MLIAETAVVIGPASADLRRLDVDSGYVVCESSHVVGVQIASGRTLEGQIISDIKQMNGVRHVSVLRSGSAFEVVVVMENMDFDPFNAVVQKELDLYSRFPNFTFHFDIAPAEAVQEVPPVNAA